MECQCEKEGWCQRYNCNMTGRMYQICKGTSGLSEEKRLAFLDNLIKSPSLLKKAVKFTWAIVKHMATGLAKVTDEAYEERLKICAGCDKLTAARDCSLCGCPVDLKASWQSESCPAGKWLSLPVTTPPPGKCGCRENN